MLEKRICVDENMSYLGSKAASGAFQKIISIMPPHDLYIETHLGTGVVMKSKPQAMRSIAIERDYEVLKKFNCEYEVEKVCGKCEEFLINNFDYPGPRERVLIYADPPYLLSTRTSRHRYKFDYTEDEHIRLLELLKASGYRVIISGYPAPLYDEMLEGWNTWQFQVMTRGGVRTEKVWFNYDRSLIGWCSYVGSDFTDRQRIKRKAARWAKKYEGLPSYERLAVMAELAKVDIETSMAADGIVKNDCASSSEN